MHRGEDVLGTLDLVGVEGLLGLPELKLSYMPPGKPVSGVGSGISCSSRKLWRWSRTFR